MASNPPPSSNGPYTALPGNAANAGGAGIMPSAGHYADMQTLMQNLDALSGWLQQNREEFDGLRDGLRRVEGMGGSRTGQELPLQNGIVEERDDSETITKLQSDLAESHARIAHLESTLSPFQTLHSLFTSTLTETMRLIRNYTYTNTNHITSLHHHYTRLLQDARYETLEAQTTHQKWQESLSHVSESVREASLAREKEAEMGGLMEEVRGLRYENRFLRRKVGWSERPFTEVEEEEIEFERQKEEEERKKRFGRESRGSLGAADGMQEVLR